MPSRERRGERIGVRRAWVSVTLVVVALATGISAWALTASSGPTYRTAGARLASVFQTLDTSGTVTAASQASLSFQVAGQVASVAVSLGEKVTAGQVVATLDTSALTAQLDAASSALSAADQTLSTDEASDASATTAASVDSASIASGQVAPTGGTTGQISAAQGVLVADQHTSDLARQAASADLAAAQSACPATGPGAGTGPGPGPGSGTGPGPGPGSGTAANAPAAGALAAGSGPHSPQGCIAALTTAFSSQAKVASDEAAVAHDELALAKLLSAASASNGPSPRRSSTPFSGRAGTGSSTTGAATPAQLAVDQATIDADQVQLINAQTSLDEAQLVSPIAGTVASLAIAAGQSVTTGSSNAAIVVMGEQTFEVTASLSVSQVQGVKVGQRAWVTPDGSSRRISGRVVRVGPAPVSSSSDYPAVVSLPVGAPDLFDGAAADVAIVLGHVKDAVCVPTSAVHLLADFAFVRELSGNRIHNVRVTLGVTGATLVQVTSGVKAGTQVVLADLSAALPSPNTTTGPGAFAGIGALTGRGGFTGRRAGVVIQRAGRSGG